MIGEHNSIRLDPVKNGFPWRGLLKLIYTMPFIYSLIIPIALLDLLATIYVWLCFPVYGLPRIKRSDFMNLQRRDLSALNIGDRFNCYYCAYANSVSRYFQRVVAETERMWCPIRMKARQGFTEHQHHAGFVDRADKRTLEAYYVEFEGGLARGEGARNAAD